MPSLQSIAVLATSVLPLALTHPAGGPQIPPVGTGITALASKVQGFSVKQVYNPNFSVENGHAAWQRATAKYNHLQSSSVGTTTTSTPGTGKGKVLLAEPGDADTSAIDSSDLSYLTPVTVGGKNYLLNFDTGSSNLWVGGASTTAKNKYTPSTQAVSGQSWSITYGDGTSASGDVYKETVVIGETTATQVAVGRATAAPANLFYPGANGQPGADGLLGLGFSSANTFNPQEKTWFDTAVAQGLSNVFAANLMPGMIPGSFDFGQLNSASYSGGIEYLDVLEDQPTSGRYWMVAPTQGDVGVMDTGTTLILLSSATTQQYYSSPASIAAGATYIQESGQSYWAFNCNSTLPDFTVQLGDNVATVPGSFLNYQVLQDGLCYAAIQNRDPSMGFSIYGDRFLMTQYVVFDQRSGSPRIGFANKAQ